MATLKSTAHISRRAECDFSVDAKAVKSSELCTKQCIACGQRSTEKRNLMPTYLALPSTWALFWAASYGGLLGLASMAPEFAWYHSTRNIDYGFLVDVCMRWQIALPFLTVVLFGITTLPFLRWRRLRLCAPCTSGFQKSRRRSFLLGGIAIFLIPLTAYLVGQALFKPGSFTALSFASAPALVLITSALWQNRRQRNPILDLSMEHKGKLRIRGPRSIKDVLLDEQPDLIRAVLEGAPAKSSWKWAEITAGIALGLSLTFFVYAKGERLACPLGSAPMTEKMQSDDGNIEISFCVADDAFHGHLTLRRTDGSVVLGGYHKGTPTGEWVERGRDVDNEAYSALAGHQKLQNEIDESAPSAMQTLMRKLHR